MVKLSKKAIMAKGALLAVLKPMLAQDASIDLDVVLAGVKQKNWLNKKPGIIAQIKPMLAQDANLSELVQLLDKLDSEKPADNNLGEDDEVDPKCEMILAKLRGKISDEDLMEIEAMMKAPMAEKKQATDEPPQTANAANADPKNMENKELVEKKAMDDYEDDMVSKTAMDAAIRKVKKEVEAETIAKMNSIAAARAEVAPYVGQVTAMDSAESVYKAALGIMKVDIAGVHPSAYRAVLLAHQKPGDNQKISLAKDASIVSSDIMDCFPALAGK